MSKLIHIDMFLKYCVLDGLFCPFWRDFWSDIEVI